MFFGTPENIVVSMNKNNGNILNQLSIIGCGIVETSTKWIKNQKKLIKGQCYEDCHLNDT